MAELARQVLLDWHVANLHESSADILTERAQRISRRIADIEDGTIRSTPAVLAGPTRPGATTDAGAFTASSSHDVVSVLRAYAGPDEERSPTPNPGPGRDNPPAPAPSPKGPHPTPAPIPSPRRPVDTDPARDREPSVSITELDEVSITRLDDDGPRPADDPDLSRRTSELLLAPLSRDPRITVAVADGRDAGLTIDAAVRGIRQAVGALRQGGSSRQGSPDLPPGLSPDLRLTVLTADGTSVTWHAATETITVSV